MSSAGSVLMTGASGFLGSHLRRALLEEGNVVHAVSRMEHSDAETVWHRVDVANPGALRDLLNKLEPEVVFHLASEVTGSRDLSAVLPTFEANLASTAGLLLGAAECGCRRVVLAGSMEELGGAQGIPGSPYAASKHAASTYARMFHAVYAVSVVNLRLFMLYGPGQTDSRKLIPYTITSLLEGLSPEISSGTRPVDWIYVADVVAAFMAAKDATQGDDGTPIDIGSGQLVTIRNLVEEIARRIPSEAVPRFGALPDRRHESLVGADIESACAYLGWSPQTSLAEGLDATVDWFATVRTSDRSPGR